MVPISLIGVLTDRDIALGIVAADRDPLSTRVGDIMSKSVVTAREDHSLLDLLSAMRRKAVGRIPVTGPRGNLIGIVAIDDVLEVLAQQMQAVATAVAAASSTWKRPKSIRLQSISLTTAFSHGAGQSYGFVQVEPVAGAHPAERGSIARFAPTVELVETMPT